MAQLVPYIDLPYLGPHGYIALVINTLLSLNMQHMLRAVYPFEFKYVLMWICYGLGKWILQCAAEKKALLAEVEALPPEEFEFPTFDDATFGLPALPVTFDDLAHEFNLHPALPVPPVEFASSDDPIFDDL